ncbi:hypothetical protein KFE25_003248 [Diacronema lutheri]|uniref:S1 motif domain-containing protein n=1 Tax=Diacronema lutheri TaxID=2081491 RepID=A0A8J5XRP5_DIALT|nr:hypothetical protein KFE25_003248 [Diacronema lutheri]
MATSGSSYSYSSYSSSRSRSRSPEPEPAPVRQRASRWGEAPASLPPRRAPDPGSADGGGSGRQYRARAGGSPARGGGGGGGGGGAPVAPLHAAELPPDELPIEGMCYRATVVSVREFGFFVKIPGYAKQGLVHISQLAPHRVDASELRTFAREGDAVWVKVLALEGTGPTVRIACSMKVVDQEDGRDLDPDDEEGQARRAGGGGAPAGGSSAGGVRAALGGGFGGGGAPRSTEPPALFSIHRGTVRSHMPFGAFIELDGFAKQGLCHISQLSDSRVDVSELESLCPLGSAVWAKVDKVDSASGKYGLSLKVVDQLTGVDLDPEHAAAERGGGFGARGGGSGAAEPGALVRKPGGAGPALEWGHMAADVYRPPPGAAAEYDFVVDEDDALIPAAGAGALGARPAGERTLADVWRDGPVRDLEADAADVARTAGAAAGGAAAGAGGGAAMLGVGLESVARAEALLAQAMGAGAPHESRKRRKSERRARSEDDERSRRRRRDGSGKRGRKDKGKSSSRKGNGKGREKRAKEKAHRADKADKGRKSKRSRV